MVARIVPSLLPYQSSELMGHERSGNVLCWAQAGGGDGQNLLNFSVCRNHRGWGAGAVAAQRDRVPACQPACRGADSSSGYGAGHFHPKVQCVHQEMVPPRIR